MLMNCGLSQLDLVEGETIGGVWLRMSLSDSTYLQSADEIIAMMWSDMHTLAIGVSTLHIFQLRIRMKSSICAGPKNPVVSASPVDQVGAKRRAA